MGGLLRHALQKIHQDMSEISGGQIEKSAKMIECIVTPQYFETLLVWLLVRWDASWREGLMLWRAKIIDEDIAGLSPLNNNAEHI